MYLSVYQTLDLFHQVLLHEEDICTARQWGALVLDRVGSGRVKPDGGEWAHEDILENVLKTMSSSSFHRQEAPDLTPKGFEFIARVAQIKSSETTDITFHSPVWIYRLDILVSFVNVMVMV